MKRDRKDERKLIVSTIAGCEPWRPDKFTITPGNKLLAQINPGCLWGIDRSVLVIKCAEFFLH